MALPKIQVEKELGDGRVFVAAHDMMVDVHVTEDGITVQITKGNLVIDECSADIEA